MTTPSRPVKSPENPVSARQTADLQDLLDRAWRRLADIEADRVDPRDPAYGSRCHRAGPLADGRAYVCAGCDFSARGPCAHARNAVCSGLAFIAETQAKIADLDGRTRDAADLRGFVA